MKVLIVEDYEPARRAVAKGLTEAGFEVDLACDGSEGLRMAVSSSFDVILLDLMLPKMDGLAVLQKIREAKVNSTVVIVTSRDAVEDRIKGLDLGADDYLIKPFAMGELLARVRAMIRRKYAETDPVITVADLQINTVRCEVKRGGQTIDLTAREYALIEYLGLRAGELVSRTDIWDHVYAFHSDAQSNVVDVYIGYLRKKIERPGCPKLIHTRRGQGYILGGPS